MKVCRAVVPAFLCILASSPLTHAQTGITVAGFGYRTPADTIVAAPGQVLTVSVFGVATRIPATIVPVLTNGLPMEVNGISADFVQGPVTVQLGIRAVQQTPCPTTGACSPATTLTIQIPYELDPASSAKASLRIKEGGATVATVALQPVTDHVHVINTCDQTGIFLSLAADVPAGSCVPMVMHPHGPLVSFSAPAVPGETVVVWAYGMGAIDHPIPDACCVTPDQYPLAVQPVTVNLSYANAGEFPLRRLTTVAPSYAGMVGSGLYQVQFVVPPVPANFRPCTGEVGNLTILVSGPTSADSAQVCVQP